MWTILSSFEFWFGASVLCTYQCAKFNELSSPDQAIPNLRAHDFAGRFTFTGALAAFLLATFIVYFVACQASPEIIKTIGRFYGMNVSYDLENYGGSIPVYIAAAFMGVTQSAIPVFSRFADKQRSVFHALMGIPRIVTASSGSFTTQILARASTKNELGREVQDLIGDAWLKKLDAYADVDFYRQQLKRMNLDDESEVRELLRGSRRELRNVLGQLIYAAALATARESGPKSLMSLAADLRVLRRVDTLPTRIILGTGMIFLIGAFILWSVIPMLDGMAARFLLGPSATDLWPATPDLSVPYVFSQVGPILVATVVALTAWSNIRRETAKQSVRPRSVLRTLAENLDRHAGVIVVIFVTVVLYDVFQALFEYGRFDNGTAKTLLHFAKQNTIFFVLHALPSLVVCFAILFYVDGTRTDHSKRKTSLAVTVLAVGSALTSLLYAAMRVKYQWVKMEVGGLDFIVLVVGLNISAAFLALVGSAFYGQFVDERDEGSTSRVSSGSDDPPVGATVALGG